MMKSGIEKLPVEELARYEYYMRKAYEEAEKAFEKGEVPVGAVVVRGNEIIAQAHNLRETHKNALYHAETMAISAACEKLGGWRLSGCELYVTLEPCPMCAGAIVNSRIEKIIYAGRDFRAGAFGSIINLNSYPLNHKAEIISGVMEKECVQLLKRFFKNKRNN